MSTTAHAASLIVCAVNALAAASGGLLWWRVDPRPAWWPVLRAAQVVAGLGALTCGVLYLRGWRPADTLFWLDLFSVSEKLTMRDLGADLQSVVLEAALNPRQTTACAVAATGRGVDSVYLYEVSRNRDFVNFITRDFDAFPLDVAGVNLLGDRFIQTRDGRKMSIGYAPDQTARLALVGELGVVVERSDGYSTSIFGPGLNWSTQ